MSSAPELPLPRADPRPAERPVPEPRALGMLWRQSRRLERRLFWRNPSAAFFNFLLPLLFLALFGAVFSDNQKDLNVIVPGIAGMSVMSTTFSALAFNMTALRELGILKRIRGTPMPGGVYLGGIAANAVTNTILQVGIIVVAGRLFFGIHWPEDGPSWWSSWWRGRWARLRDVGRRFVLFPTSSRAPAYVNAVFLPTIFISASSYDAHHAPPTFLRDIAEALPLEHVIDGLGGHGERHGARIAPRRAGGAAPVGGGGPDARRPRLLLGAAAQLDGRAGGG